MSNQLEELKKLQVKSKVFMVPKIAKPGIAQASLTFHALSLDEINLLNPDKNATEKELLEANMMAIAKSLRVPVDDVKTLAFEHLPELMDNLLEVNELGGDEPEKELPPRMKKLMEKKIQMQKENGKSSE